MAEPNVNPVNMGIGFEPVMDEHDNLHVTIHCRLGMLATSITVPELMLPQFIDNLRNALADARQMRKKILTDRKSQGLLGPSGLPITVPTLDVLDALDDKARADLRAEVLKASKVTE